MGLALAAAAAAFSATLQDLGLTSEQELGDPAELGRRAALLVAADAVWSRHLGPMLDGKQVQQLLGVRTRQAVNDLLKRGRILGLPTQRRRTVYPAFQFSEMGRPYAVLPAVLAIFADAAVSPYTIASWFKSPQALLEGNTPARWLQLGRDPRTVEVAAQRTAARLRQ